MVKLSRLAWLVGPLVSIPVAAVVHQVMWPCFVASRASTRYPLILGSVVIPTYLLLTMGSERSTVRRGVSALVVALVCAGGANLFLAEATGAVDRGKQKRSMANMQTVGRALAGVSHDVPLSPADDMIEWRGAATVGAVDASRDGWGNPILVAVQGQDRYVVSLGACGRAEVISVGSYQIGSTQDFEADIVMKNEEFVRYPEGEQH